MRTLASQETEIQLYLKKRHREREEELVLGTMGTKASMFSPSYFSLSAVFNLSGYCPSIGVSSS